MTRPTVLFVLLLAVAVGRAADPPKKFELPPTEFPKIEVKREKPPRQPDVDPNTERGKEAWAKYEAELVVYRKRFNEQLQPPKLPEGKGIDTPLGRLANAKLGAALTTLERLYARIDAGINTASEFVNYVAAAASITDASDLVFDRPADRRPWYEYRVRMMKFAELYYFDRLNARFKNDELRGLDPPYLLSSASAARLDAEIALLKLKE